MANLFRGLEGVGGRLRISNRRLHFRPHALNLQTAPLEIAMTDIVSAKKRDTWGLIPNGMAVSARDGTEYKFVLWGRGRVIRLITQYADGG